MAKKTFNKNGKKLWKKLLKKNGGKNFWKFYNLKIKKINNIMECNCNKTKCAICFPPLGQVSPQNMLFDSHRMAYNTIHLCKEQEVIEEKENSRFFVIKKQKKTNRRKFTNTILR